MSLDRFSKPAFLFRQGAQPLLKTAFGLSLIFQELQFCSRTFLEPGWSVLRGHDCSCVFCHLPSPSSLSRLEAWRLDF
jgi:hypothetical protein